MIGRKQQSKCKIALLARREIEYIREKYRWYIFSTIKMWDMHVIE